MELTYKRQNAYALADEKELNAISDYAQGYKKFLDNGKTEREVVAESVEIVEKAGYKPYVLGDKISAGDKLYYNNRSKGLFILRAGTADLAKNGVRILVAHVDSPRLDLKQVPLFEKAGLAYLKTHYYGGIKKYQWLTIPLALHGVIALKDGSKVTVRVGEEESDPVFYITDLLPHLSQEQVTKTIAEGFPAENLNLLVGGIPVKDDDKDAVKKGVLAILNEKYGVTEEDFISAELEAVPAVKAKDVDLTERSLQVTATMTECAPIPKSPQLFKPKPTKPCFASLPTKKRSAAKATPVCNACLSTTFSTKSRRVMA